MMGWHFSPRSNCNSRFVSFLLVLLFLDRLPTGASFATTANKIRMCFIAKPTPATAASVSGSPLFLAWNERIPEKGSTCSVFTNHMVSKSGLPVYKYALGGAARSTQPTGLVHDYCDSVRMNYEDGETTKMAPFLFYYNPHRYPDFMKGIREIVQGNNDSNNDTRWKREDLYLASGGTDRSERGMEQRLSDALAYSGREYLDMFVLEYVCPDETENDPESMKRTLARARSWVNEGRVRYIAASTHSHRVGAWLGSLRSDGGGENNGGKQRGGSCPPLLDAMMLRYNMAHKSAAESMSFPVCAKAGIPVLAFTTTRWNRLQAGHPTLTNDGGKDDENEAVQRRPPTTPECLSFALSPSLPPGKSPAPWPVEIVLHSARTTSELNEAMDCLSPSSRMTAKEARTWRDYGDLEWNDLDGFDEYPEEQNEA